MFECEVSKPNQTAKWFQAGDEIKDWERFTPEVEGTIHRLTITEGHLDDSAKYSCRLNGKKTSGTLTVKGPHICCALNVTNNLVSQIKF